jgi:hypothetical protein
MTKKDGRGNPRARGKEPEVSVPLYPSARLLSSQRPTNDVETVELLSEVEPSSVLDYYENLLSAQGWEQFASHHLEDRATLSFRHTEHGTLTVLVASEENGTHIRLYLKR